MDVIQVGSSCLQATNDRIRDAVFTSDQDHSTWPGTGRAVGKFSSDGESGSKIERDQGLADTWIAVDQSQLSGRDMSRPKPIDRLRPNIGQMKNVFFLGFHEGNLLGREVTGEPGCVSDRCSMASGVASAPRVASRLH